MNNEVKVKDKNGVELKVGDYVKGASFDEYSITDVNMILGQVMAIYENECENMVVKILKHNYRQDEIEHEYQVNSKYFIKVDNNEDIISDEIVCAECGETISFSANVMGYENGERLCRSCLEYRNSLKIKNYSYKPTPIFYGNNEDKEYKTIYLGIEWETEPKNRYNCDNKNETIRDFLKIWNTKDKQVFYAKEDGSLGNGAEFVSHPMTLNYIIKNKNKFKECCELLKNNDFRSHDGGHCGIHIHISKNAFGNSASEIEKNVNKLILFTEFYKKELETFSRREDYGYCQFLSKSGAYSNYSDSIYKKLNTDIIKKYKDYDRYLVVNTKNKNTIEIRVFRGTLEYTSLMAIFEFVNNLVKVIRTNSTSKITWNKVVDYGTTKFLKAYCENRGIKGNGTPLRDYARSYKRIVDKLQNDTNTLKGIINVNVKEIANKLYNLIDIKKPTELDRDELSEIIRKLSKIHSLLGYINRDNIPTYAYSDIRDIFYSITNGNELEEITKDIIEKIDEYNKKERELQDLM